jgi:two-component system, chemotaxis family, protein-glutamate methylesterase/glutaminase
VTEPRDIVVVGGSAGAIESLSTLVSHLPAELDAAIFVTVHTLPIGESLLPKILGRRGPLRAAVAADGEPIICGRVYVAPPSLHLQIEPGRVTLSGSPKENGHRPAIDPLFCSAARAYHDRVIGVVLSGTLDDGSVGLRVIRHQGGTAIVQDPEEALFPQMPRNAIDIAHPQHIAPVAEIARLISTHAGRLEKERPGGGAMSVEARSNGEHAAVGAEERRGIPSGIACPECHGVLWAATDDQSPAFRCRIGHTYAAESLLAVHSSHLEASLWAGVRALEEQASLAKHMANRAEQRGDRHSAARYSDRAGAAGEQAARMQAMLVAWTARAAAG